VHRCRRFGAAFQAIIERLRAEFARGFWPGCAREPESPRSASAETSGARSSGRTESIQETSL
jgi:hypothetical protein